MGESNGAGREPCAAVKMNAALGPNDEFIDIRDDAIFGGPQRVSGLKCLVCRHPVTVYHSRTRNRFLRHGSGDAANPRFVGPNGARAAFQNYRLAYWVRDRLRGFGVADAVVDRELEGSRKADISGTFQGAGIAVEIQWFDLSRAEAQSRTDELREQGADRVLWLTRRRDWVTDLPALGIKTFDPAGADYRADSGFLTMTPDGLTVTECSVSDTLRSWLTDEIAWAYQDHNTAGWAAVQDWEHHTRQQATTIEEQREELDRTTKLRDHYQTELATQSQELAKVRDELDQHSTTITDQRRQLADATTRQEQDADALTTARTELAETERRRDEDRRQREAATEQVQELERRLAAAEKSTMIRTYAIAALVVLCVILGLLAWLL